MPRNISSQLTLQKTVKEFKRLKMYQTYPRINMGGKTKLKQNCGIDDSDVCAEHDENMYNYRFNDLLDKFIGDQDKAYLEDMNMARKLVEFGVKGPGSAGFNRADFHKCKKIWQEKNRRRLSIASTGISCLKENKMLLMLQMREERNRTGMMSTIIYVRDLDPSGRYEISGYIDYAHRLVIDDFEEIFYGNKKLLPRKGDLSFMKWNLYKVRHRNSPNFQVIVDNPCGLMFLCKRDNKVVFPHADSPELRGASRTTAKTTDYRQVVFYDHINRQRY